MIVPSDHIVKEFTTERNHTNVTVTLSPEAVYAWTMRWLALSFLTCIIITFGFTKPDLDNDPVLKVYGIANVCISFDYSPARELMGFCFAIACIGIAFHSVLFHMRLINFFNETSSLVQASRCIAPLHTAMFSIMAISVVCHPSVSVVGHTVPYQVLMVGTAIWWIFNTVVLEHWPRPLPRRLLKIWRILSSIFVILSVYKIYLQWVLMLTADAKHKREDYIPLPHFLNSCVDPIFMVLLMGYRCWNPLSGIPMQIQFASHDVDNHYELCCWEFPVDSESNGKVEEFNAPTNAPTPVEEFNDTVIKYIENGTREKSVTSETAMATQMMSE